MGFGQGETKRSKLFTEVVSGLKRFYIGVNKGKEVWDIDKVVVRDGIN